MFEMDGYVLELKRNLYGGVASGANFFNHFKEQLNKLGFEPSEGDHNRETGCIMITYVDDCILFSNDENVIDNALNDLENLNDPSLQRFRIKVEDDYAGFLGIDIHHHEDGRVELLQTGLIEKIFAAHNLQDKDVTIRHKPAEKE